MNNTNEAKNININNEVIISEVIDTNKDKEFLWEQLEQAKAVATFNFVIIGYLLYSLKNEYASHKTGSFQKEYEKRGFKKDQVDTLLVKYSISKELNNNRFHISGDATNMNVEMKRLEECSQKTTRALKKLTFEEKEKFLQGDISSAEVREMAEEVKKNKVKPPKRVLPALKSIEKLADKTFKLKPQDYHIAYAEIEASEKILLNRKNELLEKMKEAGIDAPQ